MKARTASDIQRLALARGAEAEIGGRAFNTSQQRVPAQPPKAAPAPAPAAPPAPPALSREDVVRITAQMLAESEQRTAQAIAEQANALTLAITKALRDAAPAPGRVLVRQSIKVAYDADDRITDMTITPIYKE